MRRAGLTLALLLLSCAGGVGGAALPEAELKYRVLEQVGRPWYCDPDFYPVARDDERAIALARFAEVAADAETYRAILRHLAIADATTDERKLLAYREWKVLNALRLEPTGAGTWRFHLLVQRQADIGAEVEGTVDRAGVVRIGREQAAGPPMCPICLADDVRIDTPRGAVPVAELHVGDLVWTLDAGGRRVPAALLRAGAVRAPAGHEVVRVTLADGRSLRVSPGHPLADGRVAGSLRAGAALDGGRVVRVAREPYAGLTRDVLPAGDSGAYWANGVLLRSSLR